LSTVARAATIGGMALRDLSDPQAFVAALDEIEQEAFLKKYGFGKAQRYLLRHNGRLYDSKAIAAAAHGYQFGRPLRNDELYGGVTSAVPKLLELSGSRSSTPMRTASQRQRSTRLSSSRGASTPGTN
jgi:5-methylcytosine-specific restriction protein A